MEVWVYPRETQTQLIIVDVFSSYKNFSANLVCLIMGDWQPVIVKEDILAYRVFIHLNNEIVNKMLSEPTLKSS